MPNWDSSQYLKFEAQRTRPAVDLANRIKDFDPREALDIGCGPGNSTDVLKKTFPHAHVAGIDSSAEMIEKARERYADIEFSLLDARGITGKYDVLFSNACFQWIPDHAKLLPSLMDRLNEGGVLAAQLPMNQNEPLYRIIDEAAHEPEWGLQDAEPEHNSALTPGEYFDILSSCASAFELWETTYYHGLADVGALVEWVKGTRLRPYLARLGKDKGERFLREISERAAEAYPSMKNGEVILRFKRFFFTAVK